MEALYGVLIPFAGTALGAACLAGLAVGYWDNKEEVAKNYQADRIFTPEISGKERERLYRGWQQAVKAACAFHPEQ